MTIVLTQEEAEALLAEAVEKKYGIQVNAHIGIENGDIVIDCLPVDPQ